MNQILSTQLDSPSRRHSYIIWYNLGIRTTNSGSWPADSWRRKNTWKQHDSRSNLGKILRWDIVLEVQWIAHSGWDCSAEEILIKLPQRPMHRKAEKKKKIAFSVWLLYHMIWRSYHTLPRPATCREQPKKFQHFCCWVPSLDIFDCLCSLPAWTGGSLSDDDFCCKAPRAGWPAPEDLGLKTDHTVLSKACLAIVASKQDAILKSTHIPQLHIICRDSVHSEYKTMTEDNIHDRRLNGSTSTQAEHANSTQHTDTYTHANTYTQTQRETWYMGAGDWLIIVGCQRICPMPCAQPPAPPQLTSPSHGQGSHLDYYCSKLRIRTYRKLVAGPIRPWKYWPPRKLLLTCPRSVSLVVLVPSLSIPNSSLGGPESNTVHRFPCSSTSTPGSEFGNPGLHRLSATLYLLN